MSKQITNFQKEELIKLLIELHCTELVANYYVPDLGPDIYHVITNNIKYKDTDNQYKQEGTRSIKTSWYKGEIKRDSEVIEASQVVIFAYDHEYYTLAIRQARSMKKKVIIIPPIMRED